MTSYDKLCIREQDAIRLILEFFSRRDLCISQLSLERESGIDNCNYSDDLIFLRQLILDGQWDDVLQFVSPLESIEAFSSLQFRFIIYKHQYVELLCIRSEAASPYQTVEVAVEDIIQCLNHLEKYCPDRDTYNRLSSLLTIPNLNDDEELRNWNPNSWRLKCFNDVLPLVDKFMQPDRDSDSSQIAKNDRLMVLIFKGLMYEVCLNSIKRKLNLKNEPDLRDPDAINGIEDNFNLNAFLQSLPANLFDYFRDFNCNESLKIDIEKHDKPVLVASWSEMILSTPIKPNVFPHTAVPYTRIKAADLMSKSLTNSIMQNTHAKDLMTMSVCDIAQFSRSTLAATGFHLEDENKNKVCDNPMETSVDRLFHGRDVFHSSKGFDTEEFSKMPTIKEKPTPTDSSKDEDFADDKAFDKKDDRSMQNEDMNESYIDIWLNYQKQKNKLISQIEDTGTSSTSGSVRSAQKNRQESSKFASSQRQASSRAEISSDHLNQASNLNMFTTPKSKCLEKRKPLTSTPKLNQHSKQINQELMEEHSLWNSPIAKMCTPPPPLLAPNQAIKEQKHGLRNSSQFDLSSNASSDEVRFVPIAQVQDQQAIRAAEFHPNGRYYAVGSNSKLLRVCLYSSHDSNNNNNAADTSMTKIPQPEIMFRRQRYHKGSIYCLTWNKLGNLLATGSNDKSVKLIRFNQETDKFYDREVELNIHDGTVRDLCFMDDLTNGSSLLLSGGAGDCKIYITDCITSQTFLSLSGHSGPILSLFTWGGAMFVSGSQDRTIRFWDLRSNSCINFVTCPTISRTKPGGAVAAVCVDPTGKLLVSGHEDSTCMLYDIRGGRVIQTFHPHSSDIRTIRFSNKAYYLLTGGYDNNVALTDLQGDLTQPLKSVVVATHQDKVIQCRWHPSEFTILTTSADKTATLWALPD